MTNTKSDKPLAHTVSIVCIILILLVDTCIYCTNKAVFVSNFHNVVYWAVLVALDVAFYFASRWSFRQADGVHDNLSRGVVIALTVIHIAWALGWMAGANEKVYPGSPQMTTPISTEATK